MKDVKRSRQANWPNADCDVPSHRTMEKDGPCSTCCSIQIAKDILAENPLPDDYHIVSWEDTMKRRPIEYLIPPAPEKYDWTGSLSGDMSPFKKRRHAK